jgi:uncharacterized membrane protein YbhN (UPF0104 family)
LRAAGFAFGVALFVGLLAYLWREASAGELAVTDVRRGPLLVSAALLLAAYVAQAYAWHLLVRAVGGDLPAGVNCGRWAVSLLGKYVPGKVFNAVGRLVLYRRSSPGLAALTAASVAETLLTVTAAASVAAVALLATGGVPGPVLLAAVACAIAGAVASFSTVFDRGLGWLVSKVSPGARFASIGRSRRIVPFGLQLGSYLLLGGGLYALTLAWQPVATAPLAAVTGALCLSGIAGILAFVVPAGIGVREGALVWLLAPFTGPSFAALVAVAARVWLTAGDVIAVSVGAWLLRGSGGHDGR